MNKYVSVGKILNFHGVKGEAKVGYSKSQQGFMECLNNVFILKNNQYLAFKISHIRFNNKFAIIKFNGIDSINDIAEYKGCLIFVDNTTIRENLKEDEFLIDELVGMNVYLKNEPVGVIVGVSNNGINDLLSVKSKSKKICLIPFVKAIVPEVNIKEKKVILSDIEGLIE